MNLAQDLEGKGMVVTGAASGIGRACAELMAAAGANVFAVDRDAEGLESTVASLGTTGRHSGQVFDLRDVSGIPDLATKARSALGSVWALAHAAAVLLRRPLLEVTEEDWDLQVDVNLKASFFLNRAIAEVMVDQKMGGRIVNFSSTDNSLRASADAASRTAEDSPGGQRRGPTSDSDAYSASKAGILSITRSFARAYGPHGILVNAILPGLVDTPMNASNQGDVMEAAVARSPLGRMSRPSEVASAVLYLCSEHASYITGSLIPVNGGFTAY